MAVPGQVMATSARSTAKANADRTRTNTRRLLPMSRPARQSVPSAEVNREIHNASTVDGRECRECEKSADLMGCCTSHLGGAILIPSAGSPAANGPSLAR
jgi:hypothetical protein